MNRELLERVVLPVANEEDARATADAVSPYLHTGDEVVVLHVVEKAGGAPDKAPVEMREEEADKAFEAMHTRLSERDIDVVSELRYGTDVVETIVDTAVEIDASAVGITPREGSRIAALLGGDVAYRLVTNDRCPVISFPVADRD
ncbi:universal stress protein [Natronorarus salvus]|uniref:universal stress protein n=1 Tax=Natronorarus salvus TaxID=3117733 RepID=UPI002F26A582